MDLTIYKHNLTKMNAKELALEANRITAITRNDPKHGNALWNEWKKELDIRHPLSVIAMNV